MQPETSDRETNDGGWLFAPCEEPYIYGIKTALSADSLYLSSFSDYGSYLFHHRADSRRLPKGLILITGETGCGKTEVLNAVLFYILRQLLAEPLPSGQQPHIVAVGDPVETWLFPEYKDGKLSPRLPGQIAKFQQEHDLPVRFTARTIGLDVESISQSMTDALRETPSIFIVSELREDDDFRSAMKFGGTGHLVLATAHATSLIDAMTRLIRVEKADSASDRSLIAQRVTSLVYLKSVQVKDDKPLKPADTQTVKEYSVTLPKIWRNNSSGKRGFVSEGLASLQVPGSLPGTTGRRNSSDSAEPEPGTLSYAYAASYLARGRGDVWQEVVRRADRLDLKA